MHASSPTSVSAFTSASKSASYRPHVIALAALWLVLVAVQWTTMFTHDRNDYCYRAWECASVRKRTNPFRPHFRRDALASGDLGHMSGVGALQQHRREVFSVDEYGFRNPPGTLSKGCDVVVVGDSFAAGSYLSDDELLSGLLRDEGELRVYNYAPAPFSDYLRDTRFHAQPPRWVVLLQLERNLRAARYPLPSPKLISPKAQPASVAAVERPATLPRLRDLRAQLERSTYFENKLEPYYKGLLFAFGLYRFPDTISHHDESSGFLFHASGVTPKLRPRREQKLVRAAVQGLARYAALLEKRGSKLLVLTAPDKSTLYRDRIPFLRERGREGALPFAQRALRKAGVDSIDLLQLFSNERKAHPERALYFADDTHMNAYAHRLTYDAVLSHLREP
jgi:hypothetical protein